MLSASLRRCALAAAGLAGVFFADIAAADERAPYITQRTSLTIPFNVAAGNGDFQPVEVQVFVSYDQGKNWQLYSRHRPDEGEFLFRTKRDGEYWFATRTLDSQRKMYPDAGLKAQLKVVVDTTPPKLELTADVQASGEVNVTWKMRDEGLDADTFALAYQSATTLGEGNWIEMPLEHSGRQAEDGVTGQTTWMPQTTQRVINIRGQVKDKAGNPAVVHRQVFLPRTTTPKPDLVNVPSSPIPKPSNNLPQQMFPPAAPTTNEGTSNNVPSGLAATNPGDVRWNPNVTAPVNTNPNPSSLANEQPQPEGPGRLASSEGTPERFRPQENMQGYPLDSGSSTSANSLPFNSSPVPVTPQNVTPAVPAAPVPREPENWLANERPRLTKSKRFSLEYDVDTVSPENLGDVELWGTNDGGRSWQKWGSDNDRMTPFEVEVGSEAIYGFCIVIVARNGVSSKPPQAGDAADIWIQVDTTPPAVRLTQAAYGNGEKAGQLDIRWEANDAVLSDRPITLSFADRPEGPFTTIAAGLPNNGQFWWPFDPRSPRQIYLRVEATDAAGNVGVHSLPQPISVEGLIPRGKIRSVTTPPDAAGQEAFLRRNFR